MNPPRQTPILLLLWALLGCQTSTSSYEHPCLALAGSARDECLSRTAVRELDEPLCDRVEDPSPREECWEGLARGLLAPGYCERISSPTRRDECIGQLAPQLGAAKSCARIEAADRRGQCHADVAAQSGNAADCAEAGTPELVQRCLAGVDLKESECPLLFGEAREACEHRFFAVREDPILPCAQYTDDARRFRCYRAMARVDPKACEKLEAAARLDCVRDPVTWAAIQTRGVAHCELSSDPGFRRDCFQHYAVLDKNPALCRKLRVAEDTEACLARVARELEDPDLCVSIRSAVAAAQCADPLSHRVAAPRLCDRVTEADKPSCRDRQAKLAAAVAERR